jgi:hypothetical protein
MSERYATWIRIGGRIKRPQVESLLRAIRAAGVRTDWGDAYFEPKTVEELQDALRDGCLQLCDEEARGGEFPELERACRRLKLAYRRHAEGTCGYDAEMVDWRPGMKRPVAYTASNESIGEILVPASKVKDAIALLQAGRTQQGIEALQRLCPDLPDVPPFEIV